MKKRAVYHVSMRHMVQRKDLLPGNILPPILRRNAGNRRPSNRAEKGAPPLPAPPECGGCPAISRSVENRNAAPSCSSPRLEKAGPAVRSSARLDTGPRRQRSRRMPPTAPSAVSQPFRRQLLPAGRAPLAGDPTSGRPPSSAAACQTSRYCHVPLPNFLHGQDAPVEFVISAKRGAGLTVAAGGDELGGIAGVKKAVGIIDIRRAGDERSNSYRNDSERVIAPLLGDGFATG
jgi:hypothetical protein